MKAWFSASISFHGIILSLDFSDYRQSWIVVLSRVEQSPKKREKGCFHMLNSSQAATERILCCVLQKYQNSSGVRVLEVIRPTMMGMGFLPFTKSSNLGRLSRSPSKCVNFFSTLYSDSLLNDVYVPFRPFPFLLFLVPFSFPLSFQ